MPLGEEMKPCPFCGGEPSANGSIAYSENHEASFADGSRVREAFFVNCLACSVNNKGLLGHQTRAEAIGAWNRRAKLAAPLPDGEMQEVEQRLRQLAEPDKGIIYKSGAVSGRFERELEAFGPTAENLFWFTQNASRILALIADERAKAQGEVEEAQSELEMISEENADHVRLLDWLSDRLGLPHDEDVSQVHLAALLDRAEAAEASLSKAQEERDSILGEALEWRDRFQAAQASLAETRKGIAEIMAGLVRGAVGGEEFCASLLVPGFAADLDPECADPIAILAKADAAREAAS